MRKSSGGYVIHQAPLVRATAERHTTELDMPVSELDLKALNAVQATPWRINRTIVDLMVTAWDESRWFGKSYPGIETGVAQALPERLADDVWKAMAEEDRKVVASARAAAHAKNAQITGRTYAFMDKLSVAQELMDRPAIWYPHNRCFRGRIYPIAVHGPHPQGNDASKAMLEFAHGMPLGDDGYYWLCIRAANTYGHDKLPLEERVAWVFENLSKIQDAATSPLLSPWWMQAAEPWCFLATCLEIAAASALSAPEGFVSHLPIPMDGSCNGLQHLSAMALDPVGALATNLRAGRPRQDIYGDIARHVAARVERDVLAGNPIATTWHGKVTRTVVKRAVMTTPLT